MLCDEMTDEIRFWVHLEPYRIVFCTQPLSPKLISILSQMKTHLIHFKSNEIKPIMKIDVRFEIRENSYLRKSPCPSLFKSKLNSINLISFKLTSFSSIQLFETNLIHFGH